MKQVAEDKYSVAWFTLAECVSRGEKERALGVYRLLSHSFEDHAFVFQLEGDLLLAFNDQDAIEKYRQAAFFYHKDKRFLEAIAVYEHLRDLSPHTKQYVISLIELYKQLDLTSNVIVCLKNLFSLILKERDYTKAIKIVNELDGMLAMSDVAAEHEALVFSMLDEDTGVKEVILLHIKKAIDGYLEKGSKFLQHFLSRLEVRSEDCYLEACSYLETD